MPEAEYKRCTTCGEDQPLDDFYTDRRARDGRKSECKRCHLARANAYREANPEKAAEATRAWGRANAERRAATNRKWEQENPERAALKRRRYNKRHPETARKNVKRQRKLHPQKFRARQAVHNAVRRGKLHKPAHCESCGEKTEKRRLHAHHRDYAEPLEVTWLCYGCHLAEHGKALRLPPEATDG